MQKRIVVIGIVIVLILSGLLLLPSAQGEPRAQDDATAQQQTVDAVVQQRFTQTAAVQQQAAQTQAAQTQAAVSEPPSPPTQTAAFEATVNAAFSQAMTATVQVEMRATVEALGLEIIAPGNIARLGQINDLGGAVTDATRVAYGGQLLATGSTGGLIRLWDASSGTALQQLAGHTGDVTALAFSPDGQTLVSASQDGTLRFWDLNSGAEIRSLDSGMVNSVAFSLDGTRLAIGGQSGTVQIWDAAASTPLQTINPQLGVIHSVAFHPSGQQIAVGGEADSVRVWDLSSDALVFDLLYSPDVTAVAFSPDGLRLAAASGKAVPHAWDAVSGAQLWGAPNPALHASLAFSPDGALIATVNTDAKILVLWDAGTGARLGAVDARGPVVSVAFSPDGAGIATAGGAVRVWGVRVGSVAPTVSSPLPTPQEERPTTTPRPGATPRPEGFPTDTQADVQIVEQVFEHGRMFWIRHNRQIWVMAENPVGSEGGDWFCYNDTFQEGEQETDPALVPPDDLIQPRRGFGKLWRTQSGLRDSLGWAVTPEFDLISYYTYLAGGYMQDGQHVPGPGEHRLTTLYGDTIAFFERELRGDCLGGTWQVQPD